ncbi:hypothetical protein K502DRAFT_362110 [Neoconidiobolus thromboides FSU 785]|nr:hypothetical protein K502DRAFT_362110 [Neoconidiobolus thromboides FSU 785]
MGSSFKLENLGEKATREILYHLSVKDKVNLLTCCKKWKNIINPILWECMVHSFIYGYEKAINKSFKKYGQHIKQLNLRIFSEASIYKLIYPNCMELYLPLDGYLRHEEHFGDIPLVGLYYTKQTNNMEIGDYFSDSGNCTKEIFQNLKYLEVISPDGYFVVSIVPYLPSTITSITLQYIHYIDFVCFWDLLDKLNNLKKLKLTNSNIALNNFNLLLSKHFAELKQLHIEYVGVQGLKEIRMDLNNYPKLEELYILKYSKLIFNGISNLKKLTLYGCNLIDQDISKGIFPNLNQLTLKYCKNVLSKHLYSIFSIPTITYFDMLTHHNPLFLIREIYPKKSNNIITLKVNSTTLGVDFLNFIYMSCPNLYTLDISGCRFDIDIPFSNHKIVRSSNLTNVIFRYFWSSNLDIFLDNILKSFKSIKLIIIPKHDRYKLVKYSNHPLFLFP